MSQPEGQKSAPRSNQRPPVRSGGAHSQPFLAVDHPDGGWTNRGQGVTGAATTTFASDTLGKAADAATGIFVSTPTSNSAFPTLTVRTFLCRRRPRIRSLPARPCRPPARERIGITQTAALHEISTRPLGNSAGGPRRTKLSPWLTPLPDATACARRVQKTAGCVR